MKSMTKFPQYKRDIFEKLGFDFESGKTVLDEGCGDLSDSEILSEYFNLDVVSSDISINFNHRDGDKAKLVLATIYRLPFADDSFDYVFLHDVLHHVDESNQSPINHGRVLREVGRVVKSRGYIIIVEGNRFNPLFYPHMVKYLGHNHWRQKYFEDIIRSIFENVTFKSFEAHAYPWGLPIWKIYESLMERFCPKRFLAYNCAIIRK